MQISNLYLPPAAVHDKALDYKAPCAIITIMALVALW